MLPASSHRSTPVVSHSRWLSGCTAARLFSFFFILFFSLSVEAQDTTRQPVNLILSEVEGQLTNSSTNQLTRHQIKNRTRIIAGTNIIGYSVAMIGLYSAWYRNYPQSNFHSFNDLKEWNQVDKIGHAYSAYAESKASMELWRWTGIDRKKRIWLGGMSGAFYQTVIEVLDGFSAEWGWSWADFGANFFGSGLLVAQELATARGLQLRACRRPVPDGVDAEAAVGGLLRGLERIRAGVVRAVREQDDDVRQVRARDQGLKRMGEVGRVPGEA